MTRVEATIDISAPIADVFEYASDWRRWEEWWQGVFDFTPTTEITRGSGARYAYKAWVPGIRYNLEIEIGNFEENVGWTGTSTKGPPARTQWIFERRDNLTRLTYILEYKLPVPVLGKILDVLLMRPGWQSRMNKSLQNLKIHFERQNQ